MLRVDVDEIAGVVAGWRTLPDAVMAYNDSWAIVALTALQHRGVRVPHEVAIIGADDEPIARAVTPALTTIAGEFDAFAGAVADAVQAVLAGRPADPLPVPTLRLIQRDSG